MWFASADKTVVWRGVQHLLPHAAAELCAADAAAAATGQPTGERSHQAAERVAGTCSRPAAQPWKRHTLQCKHVQQQMMQCTASILLLMNAANQHGCALAVYLSAATNQHLARTCCCPAVMQGYRQRRKFLQLREAVRLLQAAFRSHLGNPAQRSSRAHSAAECLLRFVVAFHGQSQLRLVVKHVQHAGEQEQLLSVCWHTVHLHFSQGASYLAVSNERGSSSCCVLRADAALLHASKIRHR